MRPYIFLLSKLLLIQDYSSCAIAISCDTRWKFTKKCNVALLKIHYFTNSLNQGRTNNRAFKLSNESFKTVIVAAPADRLCKVLLSKGPALNVQVVERSARLNNNSLERPEKLCEDICQKKVKFETYLQEKSIS